MLNFSLKGSQISLIKNSISSAHSSIKTNDKLYCKDSTSLNNTDSAFVSAKPNNPVVKKKAKSKNNLCSELHDINSNIGHKSTDINDLETKLNNTDNNNNIGTRCQNNVSDWLNLCTQDNHERNWTEIDLIEDENLYEYHQSISQLSSQNHYENQSMKNENVHHLKSKMYSNNKEYRCTAEKDCTKSTDSLSKTINEYIESPPPCLTRPISNKIITTQTIYDSNAEKFKLTQHYVNKAAIIIQKFWRRHKCRMLATEAALRRIMESEQTKLNQLDLSHGKPLSEVLDKKQNARIKKKMKSLKTHQMSYSKHILENNYNKDELSKMESNEDMIDLKNNNNVSNYINYENVNLLDTSVSEITLFEQQNFDNNQINKNKIFENNKLRQTIDHPETSAIQEPCKNINEIDNQIKNHYNDEIHSKVNNIIEELSQLDKSNPTNVTLTKQNSLLENQNVKHIPNTWSDMEAEQDKLSCKSSDNRYKFLKTTNSTLNSWSVKQPTPLFQCSTIRSNISNVTTNSNLNEETLQKHTRLTNSNEQRKRAKEELTNSVTQTRMHLANLTKLDNSDCKRVLQNSLTIKNNMTNSNCVRYSYTDLNQIEQHANSYNSQPVKNDSHNNESFDFPNKEFNLKYQNLVHMLEEKTQRLERSERALEHQHELTIRQLRDIQRENEQRIEHLKTNYDSTINRNYELIDELIEEKKTLQGKCETLMTELRTLSKKSEEKIKFVEEKQKIELKKTEAKHVAAEKIRREKWEIEKIKHLKEVTIKGMESELANMIANHKIEMQQLRQSCTEQIQAADTRAYQVYANQIMELKSKLLNEKEEACLKERELAEERLHQTLQSERQTIEIQRKRLFDELSDERERLTLTAFKQRDEIEKIQQQIESELHHKEEKHKSEINKLRNELTDKHKIELEEMQQRCLRERSTSEEHAKSILESHYATRELTLRDQLKKERDRLLESAIRRLEFEANETRENYDRHVELKIKRVRDKLEVEIRELERSEKQAMEKYCQIKSQQLDKEHETDRLRSQLIQKDEELGEIRLLYEKLNKERRNISDVVRQEFADQLVLVEEENRTVKRELAEYKARFKHQQDNHENELESIHKSNSVEVEKVHLKVKELLKNKEEKIVTMQETFDEKLNEKLNDLHIAHQQIEHLEELLNQQRRQFLNAN